MIKKYLHLDQLKLIRHKNKIILEHLELPFVIKIIFISSKCESKRK